MDAPQSNLRTPTYEVQVTDGEICVRVPDDTPADANPDHEPQT